MGTIDFLDLERISKTGDDGFRATSSLDSTILCASEKSC